MADLKSAEVEKAKLNFSIYDFSGEGSVDSFYLGNVLRSLDLNPTQAMIDKHGGQKKEGKKSLTIEEFLPIYSQVKKEKESGTMEDFMEGLKVYDKNENGTMMQAELAHVLLSLGERLSNIECEDIMKMCCPPSNDEGFVKYEPFLKAVLAGPFPDEDK